jgi:hypothetical protein
MSIFKVSRDEFRKHIGNHLVSNGWSDTERERMKMVFDPLLSDEGTYHGITETELNDGLTSLKVHHALSDNKISDLRSIMGKYMKRSW